MAEQDDYVHIDQLELDPVDGGQYILELRDRLLDLLSPAQTIDEVNDRLRLLYPGSELVASAICRATEQRSDKKHEGRHHSASSGASFSITLHNITSLAMATVSNLVRDGVSGMRNKNESSKYKLALTQSIIDDILKLSGKFVRSQKGNFIITRSDIQTAMYADKDLVDMFLNDVKSPLTLANHPLLARVNCTDRVRHLTTYRQKVRSMVDSENCYIRGLELIIKVFRLQLQDYPDIEEEIGIIFCNIDDLLVLSRLVLSCLEESLANEKPYVGSDLLEIAQSEHFCSYFSFAYNRLSRDQLWRKSYKKMLTSASILNLSRSDQGRTFYLALKHLLPNYLINIIVQIFDYYEDISDLLELSKREDLSDSSDIVALEDTLSILDGTKLRVKYLLENELHHEETEPLDPVQSESIKAALEKRLDVILQHERDQPLPFMPPSSMYRFSEPDTDSNIQFVDSKNRTIKGSDLNKHIRNGSDMIPEIKYATLSKLIERLTYHKYHPNIVDTFLTTYRLFISQPEELLDLLIERFRIPDPPLHMMVACHDSDLDSTKYAMNDLPESLRISYKLYINRFHQEYSKPVKMRVINVLKSWVKNHYYDFERHPALTQKLRQFLDDIYREEVVLRGLVHPIRKALESIGTRRDNIQITVVRRSHSIVELDLLTLDLNELAEQLTLYEFELFRAIKPFELINIKNDGHRMNEISPKRRLTEHINQFSYWIRKTILETEDFDRRCALYNKCIKLMRALRDLNNFTGLVSVGSALSSASVWRLRARDILPSELKKILDEYEYLCRDRMRRLKIELNMCNPPCIPFMGSYQTDLVHTEDGNRTFHDDTTTSPTLSTTNSPASPISPRTPRPPQSASSTVQNQFFASPQQRMINFHKQRISAGVVAEITNYQNQPYCLQVKPEIRKFIESIDYQMARFAISLHPDSRNSDFRFDWTKPKSLDDYLHKQSELIEPKGRQL